MFPRLQEMEFRFAEEEDPSDYCTRLAAKAHHYAPEHGARPGLLRRPAWQRRDGGRCGSCEASRRAA